VTILIAACVAWTVFTVFVGLAALNEARGRSITIVEQDEA
jgi:hypothetical protein